MAPKKVNYRLEVTPLHGWLDDGPTERDCEMVSRAIEGHVDNVGAVHIIYDRVCEFCGCGWDHNAVTRMDPRPMCCEKAQAEYDALTPPIPAEAAREGA